ncbi:MAG TPA: LolA-related protein [Steroidobacteraceae bacterium]|nr:LolA-related protein [Steroidobacteraceae bacterium]
MRLWAPAACVSLLACAAVLGAAGGGGDALDEVMHSLAQRRHGQVSFVEQQFLSMLKRPVESYGELIYDAPNRLEKRTVEPRPETLVVDGEVVTVLRGRRSRVLDLKAYPQILPFIESIRATLAGDRAALERLFRLEFTGSETRWTLGLTPLDAQLAKTVAEIRIDGARDELTRVEIRQPDGDRSLMTLRAHSGR